MYEAGLQVLQNVNRGLLLVRPDSGVQTTVRCMDYSLVCGQLSGVWTTSWCWTIPRCVDYSWVSGLLLAVWTTGLSMWTTVFCMDYARKKQLFLDSS